MLIFSLLRNTASSSLRANRSITIQLHFPRLESTAFLSYSGTPKYSTVLFRMETLGLCVLMGLLHTIVVDVMGLGFELKWVSEYNSSNLVQKQIDGRTDDPRK
jgi:hypothetical protein